jgi:hypothetical protein
MPLGAVFSYKCRLREGREMSPSRIGVLIKETMDKRQRHQGMVSLMSLF